MLITSFCQSVASSLAHNLRLATSDAARHLYAGEALRQSERALVALSDLLVEKGERCEEYGAGRDAALDLITTAGIIFVRSTTNYSEGIVLLEELSLRTNDNVLRKKLRTYANQLKKRWNDAEPGGILHAPRSARVRKPVAVGDGTHVAILIFAAIAAAAIYLTISGNPFRVDIERAEPPQSVVTAQVPLQEENPPRDTPENTVDRPAPGRDTSRDYCRYTDEGGVVHLVNTPADVPLRYRSQLKVVAPGEGDAATRVTCANDRVLVPVTLRYQGREVETVLLLDTGASTTTVNEALASRLGIDRTGLQVVNSIVADGRVVPSHRFRADLISVGPKAMSGAMISILPGSGDRGAEGLLGMNFLKEFRYHVDFKRGVIEWGS